MKLPRRLLECVRNNFLMQLLNKPARGGGLLHVFVYREGLVGDVEVRDNLGHNDC